MSIYIRSQSDVKHYLRDSAKSNNGLVDLCIEPDRGYTIDFTGVKWVGNLEIYERDDGKPITLVFPDLMLIAGDTTITRNQSTKIIMPKLEAVRGFVFAYSDPENLGAFRDLKENGCDNRDLHKLLFDRLAVHNRVVIASDDTYILRYKISEDRFHAGCRTFKTIDEAIGHWTARAGESDDIATMCSQERGLMFAVALTFFKDEMKRGGLL